MPSPPAQRRPPATEFLAAREDGFSYIYCTDTRRKRIGRFEASFHVASLQTARHLCSRVPSAPSAAWLVAWSDSPRMFGEEHFVRSSACFSGHDDRILQL